MENNIGEAIANALVASMQAQVEETERNYNNPPDTRPAQEYAIGEIVDVQSWTSTTRAKITGVEWIFHQRLGNWTWGYSVDQPCGLSFHYVPEGYLRKVSE